MKIDGAIPRLWPVITTPPDAQVPHRADSVHHDEEPVGVKFPRAVRSQASALHHRELQNFPVGSGVGVNPYINWSDSRLALELGNHFPAMEKHYDR